MTLQKFEHALRVAPALALEVKADADGTIEGIASTFGGEPDRQNDIVARGAFTRTLLDHKAQGTAPGMLWAHRLEEPIGRWLEVREADQGLLVAGRVNMKSDRGRQAFEHISAGDAVGLSIGYIVPDGGRKYVSDGVFELLDVDLVEVSVTAAPANRRARITAVKSLASRAELVDLLRDGGLPKAAAARVAAVGWPALANEDHHQQQKALELADVIARATADLRRS